MIKTLNHPEQARSSEILQPWAVFSCPQTFLCPTEGLSTLVKLAMSLINNVLFNLDYTHKHMYTLWLHLFHAQYILSLAATHDLVFQSPGSGTLLAFSSSNCLLIYCRRKENPFNNSLPKA